MVKPVCVCSDKVNFLGVSPVHVNMWVLSVCLDLSAWTSFRWSASGHLMQEAVFVEVCDAYGVMSMYSQRSIDGLGSVCASVQVGG